MELSNIEHLEKKECTGCCVCSNACPVNAIIMQSDNNGFIYPKINYDICIHCGICIRVCQGRKKVIKESITKVYAAWSKDDDLRYTSTSGGVFSELAKYVLKKGGKVVGAAYDNANSVEHILIDDIDKLSLLRQSKYVQSDSKDIYKKVKYALDQSEFVLFCGTPCQIAGLRSYLGVKYKNLLMISFIWLGVNSPKAFKSWLKDIECKEKNKVKKVWFKYKDKGWKKSPLCTRIDFYDGKYKVYYGLNNTFMNGYIGHHFYVRPSCNCCNFKGLAYGADIVVADFWGRNDQEDKGVSLVIVNNEFGEYYLEQIKCNMVIQEEDYNKAVLGNPALNSSVASSKYREMFLRDLDKNCFSKVYRKYTNNTFKKKIYMFIRKYASFI